MNFLRQEPTVHRIAQPALPSQNIRIMIALAVQGGGDDGISAKKPRQATSRVFSCIMDEEQAPDEPRAGLETTVL